MSAPRILLSSGATALPDHLPLTEEGTQICVARHGETDWNVAGILQGWLDVSLNESGRRQAVELAQVLKDAGFSRLYSSSLARAWEAADLMAERLGLSPAIRLDGWRERCFGVIQGIPKSELAESNPLLLQQILARNPAAHFEQGETMDEFADRVLTAISAVAAECPGYRVLVVTHGWVLDVITRHINGLARNTILNHKPKNSECLWLTATEKTIRPLVW
jgi:probable phosphoglycerate mutase